MITFNIPESFLGRQITSILRPILYNIFKDLFPVLEFPCDHGMDSKRVQYQGKKNLNSIFKCIPLQDSLGKKKIANKVFLHLFLFFLWLCICTLVKIMESWLKLFSLEKRGNNKNLQVLKLDISEMKSQSTTYSSVILNITAVSLSLLISVIGIIQCLSTND